MINAAELRMSRLRNMLKDEGLLLVYPPSLASLRFGSTMQSGKPLAEILLNLWRPHGLGFFVQGNSIRVIPEERKRPEMKGNSPYQASLVRATFQAKVGEALDLWVDSAPLVRLRIVAQPLYGESDSNVVAFALEGHRDQKRWFYHEIEAHMGEESQIDAKGGGHMWCVLTPAKLDGNTITIKMEFYYETILASA